jgi:hypothetical protein
VDADPFGTDHDVATVADLARQFGHHAGRAWFSGARADEAAGSVTVFRVPNHGFDEELRLLLGTSVPLVLEDARHTREELTVAREEAWAFGDELQIDAITIPDDGSGINVFVHVPVADAQTVLNRALPGLARALDASLGVSV